MDYETRQMGLNQFLELHKQEQKMRLLMEHISNVDRYAEQKKRLKTLEAALNVYTAKLGRATRKSIQAKKDKEEANDDYMEARNRRDFPLDSLFDRVDRAYVRCMNTSTDVLRLTYECDYRKEQISELSFQLNRLKAKMIRMKNPCFTHLQM
jgi:hypothetical protein